MKFIIESSEKLQTLSDLRQEISLPVIKELNSSKTLHAQLNPNNVQVGQHAQLNL